MPERQRERLDDYPEVRQRIEQHLRETQGLVQRLVPVWKAADTRSALKDTAQSVMGNMAAMAHTVADDEILKNTFANNAFENFAIAADKSLPALCGPAGANACAEPLQANLREEEAVASWSPRTSKG